MTPTRTEQTHRSILVTGATGRQGGATARHLLKEEQDLLVRALTRDPDQPDARELERMGAEVVRGDFEDPATLAAALEGAHGVFSVQNFWTLGPEKEVEYGLRMIEMAGDAGVRHFVYASVASADRDTGLEHFETKRQIEATLERSDLPHTILRPVFFMQNWEAPGMKEMIRDGQLAQPLRPDTPLQMVDVDDVGRVAARAFREPSIWLDRTVELAGDELSMAEIAAAFGRVLGRNVAYAQLAWDDFARDAGEEAAQMYQWFENVGYDVDLEALLEEIPDLQPFEAYLARRWADVEAPV